MFCSCGKMMTPTEFGFECVCGNKADADGNFITDARAADITAEAERIAAIKAKYHSKYPNISDPLVRVTVPVEESAEMDETFSDVPPSARGKVKKKRFFR